MSEPDLQILPQVLVVEDDPLVAMDIEDMLDALGVRLLGPVASISAALRLIEVGGFDGVLLDVNLRGERVDAVADALAEKGIPFVFTTGYGAEGLPERHRAQPMLNKPFDRTDLAAALTRYVNPG